MPSYQAKPVTVEARQWDGTQAAATDLVRWVGDGGMLAYYETTDGVGRIVINTLHGPLHARAGDWIVKGVMNEFFPCRAEIFDLAYEPAAP